MYEFLGKPFGLILRLMFEYLNITNYAALIVIITLLARVIMIPTSISQQKGMAKTQRMQAKIRKIQEKYAGDQKKIQEETQALYQREGYNPINAGCAPLLVQFIVLFGLIGVIYYPLSNFLNIDKEEIDALIAAVKTIPGFVNPTKNERLLELAVIDNIDTLKQMFLDGKIKGVELDTFNMIQRVNFTLFGISLGDVPMNHKNDILNIIWLIPIVSTLTTLGSSLYSSLKQKQSGGAAGQAAKSMGCMTVGMSLFSLYFVCNYPAGIGIYWIASGALGLLSTVIIGQLYSPKKMLARTMVEETVERRSREKSIKLAKSKNEEK